MSRSYLAASGAGASGVAGGPEGGTAGVDGGVGMPVLGRTAGDGDGSAVGSTAGAGSGMAAAGRGPLTANEEEEAEPTDEPNRRASRLWFRSWRPAATASAYGVLAEVVQCTSSTQSGRRPLSSCRRVAAGRVRTEGFQVRVSAAVPSSIRVERVGVGSAQQASAALWSRVLVLARPRRVA